MIWNHAYHDPLYRGPGGALCRVRWEVVPGKSQEIKSLLSPRLPGLFQALFCILLGKPQKIYGHGSFKGKVLKYQ